MTEHTFETQLSNRDFFIRVLPLRKTLLRSGPALQGVTNDFKGMRIRFASPTIRDFIVALGGTPEDCCRTLEALQTSGVTRVDIYLQGPNRAETVRLFAKEVIPRFGGGHPEA